MINNSKKANWVKRIARWTSAENDSIKTLQLKMVSRTETAEIESCAVEGNDWDRDTIKQKVEEFCDLILEDSDEVSALDPRDYFIAGLDENGAVIAQTSKARVSNDETSEFVENLEQASGTGLLGQQMRHNEALVKTVVLHSTRTIETQARQIENYQRQLADMEERRWELQLKAEQMANEETERAIKLSDADSRQKNIQMMLQSVLPQLVPLAPQLVAGLVKQVKPDLGEQMEANLEEQKQRHAEMIEAQKQIAAASAATGQPAPIDDSSLQGKLMGFLNSLPAETTEQLQKTLGDEKMSELIGVIMGA